MIEALKGWAGRRRGRNAPSRPGLPPGVDEIRLLESPDALRMAELAGIIGALDQSIAAMRRLESDRTQSRTPADSLADLALLRFAMVQFVDCFTARKGSARLSAKKAFDASGQKFFAHVAEFAAQLSGAHARVVGETETVVLLKRAGDRAGVIGLTTRARRPERLTQPELASLADFMEVGRGAYARMFDDVRLKVMDEVEGMPTAELLGLELRESANR